MMEPTGEPEYDIYCVHMHLARPHISWEAANS